MCRKLSRVCRQWGSQCPVVVVTSKTTFGSHRHCTRRLLIYFHRSISRHDIAIKPTYRLASLLPRRSYLRRKTAEKRPATDHKIRQCIQRSGRAEDRRSRGAGGAKHRSAKEVWYGEGRHRPSPLGVLGLCPRKMLQSTLKSRILCTFAN